MEDQITYITACGMLPDQIKRVSEMIDTHPEFSGTTTTFGSEEQRQAALLLNQIKESQVLVRFSIPHEVDMIGFNRELLQALHPPVAMRKERSR